MKFKKIGDSPSGRSSWAEAAFREEWVWAGRWIATCPGTGLYVKALVTELDLSSSWLTCLPCLYMCFAGTSVMQVTATDADDPTYGNSARLVYSILQGQPYFSVEPQTGEDKTSLQGPTSGPSRCLWICLMSQHAKKTDSRMNIYCTCSDMKHKTIFWQQYMTRSCMSVYCHLTLHCAKYKWRCKGQFLICSRAVDCVFVITLVSKNVMASLVIV